MRKVINFIKYNNFAVLLVLAVFLFGGGVFAQTEAGQDAIGRKQTRVEGTDNTLLLEAELDSFDMDFKIEKIEKDDKYYYITYTYLDLAKENGAWQYQMAEDSRKVPLDIKKDIGEYMADELKEEYEARIKDLKNEKIKAMESGEETRTEVTEYTGLVGQTLDVAAKIFPGYESVKKKEIPTPSIPPTILLAKEIEGEESIESVSDNLTDVYNNYIAEMDPDKDDAFGSLDNCPDIYNPDQIDSDNNGIGDACDVMEAVEEPAAESATGTEETADSIEAAEEASTDAPAPDETPEPESVQIIELPINEALSQDIVTSAE